MQALRTALANAAPKSEDSGPSSPDIAALLRDYKALNKLQHTPTTDSMPFLPAMLAALGLLGSQEKEQAVWENKQTILHAWADVAAKAFFQALKDGGFEADQQALAVLNGFGLNPDADGWGSAAKGRDDLTTIQNMTQWAFAYALRRVPGSDDYLKKFVDGVLVSSSEWPDLSRIIGQIYALEKTLPAEQLSIELQFPEKSSGLFTRRASRTLSITTAADLQFDQTRPMLAVLSRLEHLPDSQAMLLLDWVMKIEQEVLSAEFNSTQKNPYPRVLHRLIRKPVLWSVIQEGVRAKALLLGEQCAFGSALNLQPFEPTPEGQSPATTLMQMCEALHNPRTYANRLQAGSPSGAGAGAGGRVRDRSRSRGPSLASPLGGSTLRRYHGTALHSLIVAHLDGGAQADCLQSMQSVLGVAKSTDQALIKTANVLGITPFITWVMGQAHDLDAGETDEVLHLFMQKGMQLELNKKLTITNTRVLGPSEVSLTIQGSQFSIAASILAAKGQVNRLNQLIAGAKVTLARGAACQPNAFVEMSWGEGDEQHRFKGRPIDFAICSQVQSDAPLACVEALVNAGSNISRPPRETSSPLVLACRYSPDNQAFDMIQYLCVGDCRAGSSASHTTWESVDPVLRISPLQALFASMNGAYGARTALVEGICQKLADEASWRGGQGICLGVRHAASVEEQFRMNLPQMAVKYGAAKIIPMLLPLFQGAEWASPKTSAVCEQVPASFVEWIRQQPVYLDGSGEVEPIGERAQHSAFEMALRSKIPNVILAFKGILEAADLKITSPTNEPTDVLDWFVQQNAPEALQAVLTGWYSGQALQYHPCSVDGETPLHLAVSEWKSGDPAPECLKKLLKHAKDNPTARDGNTHILSALDSGGFTPFQRALMKSASAAIALWKDFGLFETLPTYQGLAEVSSCEVDRTKRGVSTLQLAARLCCVDDFCALLDLLPEREKSMLTDYATRGMSDQSGKEVAQRGDNLLVIAALRQRSATMVQHLLRKMMGEGHQHPIWMLDAIGRALLSGDKREGRFLQKRHIPKLLLYLSSAAAPPLYWMFGRDIVWLSMPGAPNGWGVFGLTCLLLLSVFAVVHFAWRMKVNYAAHELSVSQVSLPHTSEMLACPSPSVAGIVPSDEHAADLSPVRAVSFDQFVATK